MGKYTTLLHEQYMRGHKGKVSKVDNVLKPLSYVLRQHSLTASGQKIKTSWVC